MLCLWLLGGRHSARATIALVRVVQARLRAALAWPSPPKRVLAIAGRALACCRPGAGTRLGTEFLPELTKAHVGEPHAAAVVSPEKRRDRCAPVCDDALRTVPEVTRWSPRSGRPDDGTDPKMIQHRARFSSDSIRKRNGGLA